MNKYEVDEHKTQITLKSCDEEDGGVYVWICGKCNINKQFTLEVFEDSNSLKCVAGNDVHFSLPHCADGLDSCKFMNPQEEYVMLEGLMSRRHSRYEFVENSSRIILTSCNETDEGMYVWTCDKCDIKMQFHVGFHAIAIPFNEDGIESILHGKTCRISNADGKRILLISLLALVLQRAQRAELNLFM